MLFLGTLIQAGSGVIAIAVEAQKYDTAKYLLRNGFKIPPRNVKIQDDLQYCSVIV